MPYALRAASTDLSLGFGLQGAGTAASPLAVSTMAVPSRSWGGLRLDAEGVVDGATVGVVASDATAHGGQVRRGIPGTTSGRVFGVVKSTLGGQNISDVPARIVARVKVDANTTATSFGQLQCSSRRGGVWSQIGASGILTPQRFAATNTWTEIEAWCPFQ